MDNGLINEGLTLMLAGMGTVFVFLTVLVVAMNLMSWLVSFAAEAAPAGAAPTGGGVAAGDEEIAAISAAIREHRRK